MLYPSRSRTEWRAPPDERLFRASFSLAECNRIIERYRGAKVNRNQVPFDGRTYRDSDLRWITPADPDAAWIYQRMDDVACDWNRDFGFVVDGVQDLQLGYYGPGQNYEWHTDLGPTYMSRRKISVVAALSPPEEYKGGVLQTLRNGGRYVGYDLQAGDAVAFPSWKKHRVTAVTEGGRWSLVAWFTGPPFR